MERLFALSTIAVLPFWLVMMFGPIGFLLYLGISHSIAWSTDAAAETTSSRPGKEL